MTNLNISQKWKVLKQRYYRKINTLGVCRPVLLSVNIQTELVAESEGVQTTILSEH